ncbi:MAG TPA: glycosyltransferase, partial [Chloroflexota bacterium]|nr:glycosyltransferase [Chloroflexota bacterium]
LGRFHPNKGADLAIEVARRAGRRLIIAAPAPPDDQRDWFETKIRPHLGGDVEWIGPVEGTEKARLLGNAAATLAPIRWDEPFGLVFAESMACGTPPVAFRRGAAPEVIEDGVSGFLVDDVQAMAHALDHVQRIQPLACRERVERHFSATRMVEEHERLYQRLIEGESANLSPPLGEGIR